MINAFEVLFMVLLVIKLTGLASITWWIVFTPIIIPVALWLILTLIALIFVK